MGSRAVIYIPSFINTGSGIQRFMGDTYRNTHRQEGDFISLLLYLENQESRLKILIPVKS
jgi:hypothetical protein